MCILSGLFPGYQKAMLRDNIFSHFYYLNYEMFTFEMYLQLSFIKEWQKAIMFEV